MPLREHVYCVAIALKMTEYVKQQICIRFCIKHEHSSMETVGMIQTAIVMGNWFLATSWITSCAGFFGKALNHAGDSVPLQPRFGSMQLLAFPKPKITFEREDISDCQIDSGIYDGAVDGRTVWGPKVPTLKGTEVSLSYVQCFLYLVSSSIKGSIS